MFYMFKIFILVPEFTSSIRKQSKTKQKNKTKKTKKKKTKKNTKKNTTTTKKQTNKQKTTNLKSFFFIVHQCIRSNNICTFLACPCEMDEAEWKFQVLAQKL